MLQLQHRQNKQLVTVAYGMGTNSTGLICGLKEKGITPDLITTADTGGERPDTYEYCRYFSDWCVSVGFPAITIVKRTTRAGDVETLEELCNKKHALPSLAYGFKTCSEKFKIRPQNKFLNHWEPAVKVWNTCVRCCKHRREHAVKAYNRWCMDGVMFQGGKVVKLIGYDAGESRRAKMTEDEKYIFRYPLIEWNWDRDACIEAIKRAGLRLPGKSACFFCPSSRKPELIQLRETYPELMDRALKMESEAELTSIKGLGRNYSWAEFLRQYDAGKVCATNEQTTDIPCGCYDGGEE